MHGLMMQTPLTIPGAVVPRAEGIYSHRPVTTRTGGHTHRATYGQTVARARRLAAALGGLGVSKGDRVATFAWNTHRHLEAYLAAPSIGAVLHTLNVRLFPAQVAYIVEHADDSIVLCDRSLLGAWRVVEQRLARRRPLVVMPDVDDDANDGDAVEYEALLARTEPLTAFPEIDENAAAAMCYTSGTTGDPKGVVYSHRSDVLHTLAVGLAEGLAISSADSVCVVVPMFHANSWGIPYAAAMLGAGVILPGRDLSPAALCDLIESERPTIAAGVPTIWTAVLDHWRQHRPDLSSLRFAIGGGSAIPAALSRAWETEIGVPIVQAWGMTETSPLATVAWVPTEEIGSNASEDVRRHYISSQGRPLPLVDLQVVDADGRVVRADGQSVGEIRVRGPWIAREYYKDGAPSDRFADGWLRTGDVATVDELGFVRIVDRTKDLVKSGGEWISSVELEGHLMAHPDVAEAAVIAVPDQRWEERPLACVVLRKGAETTVSAADLIDFLRPRVARWWLPDGIVFIDEVPKTSVGKFDKRTLRGRFKAVPEGAAVNHGAAHASR